VNVSGATNAGFLLGNGTGGNILNTYMHGCSSSSNLYGVYANYSNFIWSSGTMQKNGTDIAFAGGATSESVIENFRSENSGILLSSPSNAGGSGLVSLRNISWAGGGSVGPYSPPASGMIMSWGYSGLLILENIAIYTAAGTGVQPVIGFPSGSGYQLSVIANNLSTSAPYSHLFSCGPESAVVYLTGYMKLDPATNYNDTSVSQPSGTLTLMPSPTEVLFQGSYCWFMQSYMTTGVVALTDGSTVPVDASLGNDFRWSPAASGHTLSNPTNPADGKKIIVQVTQPASGGTYTILYGTAYLFSASLPAPTLSTTASATDLLGFIYNAAIGKWLFVAFAGGL
jgi:hypothetical protein